MTDLRDAAVDVIHTLATRGYSESNMFLYVHPYTRDALKEQSRSPAMEGDEETICGVRLLTSEQIPTEMSLGVAFEGLRRGRDDAVAFATAEPPADEHTSNPVDVTLSQEQLSAVDDGEVLLLEHAVCGESIRLWKLSGGESDD